MTYEAVNKAGDETLITLAQSSWNRDDWIISTWGKSSLMGWSADNVTQPGDGTIRMVLDRSDGATPYDGAEFQSAVRATYGTWSWLAKAPVLPEGVVFAMFTYKAFHQTQDWIEFDFEFVKGDTTRVELNVHMLDADGRHVMQAQSNADGPYTVDLGFDAAEGFHLYEIEVMEDRADFRIDGAVVGSFGAEDMPGNTWYAGVMKSYTSVWAVTPNMEGWAGQFAYPDQPVEAVIAGLGTPVDPLEVVSLNTPPGWDVILADLEHAIAEEALGTGGDDRFLIYHDLDAETGRSFLTGEGDDFVKAGNGDDVIFGGAGNDQLRGGGGNDIIVGGDGADSLQGNDGDDLIFVGSGDRVDGGAGADTFVFTDMLEDYVMMCNLDIAGGDRIDVSLLGISADQISLRQVKMWTLIQFAPEGDTAEIAMAATGEALDVQAFVDAGAFVF
ncbi:family 16 glycosylhydrolase [Sagittula sp. S175]|uniref:family 16 glycosylhydrolase n=1 Tax=Sagittula sp. S175 TaxID=3415129 RepID=UPI003C7E34B9